MGWSSDILITISFILFITAVHSQLDVPKCDPDDRSALLGLKTSLQVDPDNFCYRSNKGAKTSNWSESTNCCTWKGVTCDNVTGHVIGLDLRCGAVWGVITSESSLFALIHLESLDLSLNHFNGSSIVPEFGRFKNMTHLDLSDANFIGSVPMEISGLSGLVHLRIQDFYGRIKIGEAIFKALTQNLRRLRELDLSYIDLSSVSSLGFRNMSSSFKSLSLSYCKLRAEIPENVFRLPNLQVLKLNSNLGLTGHFPNPDNWTNVLQELDLSNTGFSVDLPNLLETGKFLSDLYLGNINFINNNSSNRRIIPWSSFNLNQIRSLDLSNNRFIGPIPDNHVFPYLTYLDLSNNFLNGTVPTWIFQLKNLFILNLSSNKLSGTISEFRSKSVFLIMLNRNKLHGSVPRSIFRGVIYLDLSYNSFTGIVDLIDISKSKMRGGLDLSFNSISLYFNNSINYTLRYISSLGLSSCNISEFPSFLRSTEDLFSLDLSSNKIQGSVPKWLWEKGKDSFHFLNLSRNSLTFMDPLPWSSLKYLDLRSNLFSGPIPIASAPLLEVLLGSKNKFSGEISTSICSMKFLSVLDLSYNNLTGNTPSCFANFSESLSVLDLKRNRLHGTIPTTFPKSNSLRNLNLNGNHLEGKLPRSLVNCTNLEVLDVGNNLLNDTFPSWIESLPKLRVLVLRSNMFHGSIGSPKSWFLFQELRIIDLSVNKFNGPIPPKFFANFEAMMNSESVKMEYMGENYYKDSVMVTIKGSTIELEKIQTILTTIDFSCNNFTGGIPRLIGRLKSLKGLNFSYNMLSSTIPLSVGDLINLEWLDLSSNQLVGEIPPDLARLVWLSSLNLSRNQLVGPIPHGSQFNTFSNESFSENLDLCGFPISKSCDTDRDELQDSDGEGDDSNGWSWFEWKVVLMGYACGVLIGLFSGFVLLCSNGKLSWLSESILLELALLSRKCRSFFP